MIIENMDVKDSKERAQHPNSDNTPSAEVDHPEDDLLLSQALDVHAVKLLHELRVHQIELEQQNEELVNARSHAEAALSKYVDLYDHAPFAYFTLTPGGVIIKTNIAGVELLGEEHDHLINKPLIDFVTPESRALFDNFWQQTASANLEKECRVQLHILDSRFQKHTARMLSRIVQDAEIHVAVIDITEMDLAAKKLKIASDVFTCAHEGIVITNHKGEIVDLNDSSVRITGYEKNDMLGLLPWFFFVSMKDIDYHKIRNSLSHDGYWAGEIHGQRKNSDPVTLQLAISCSRGADNAVAHYIGIFTDISEIHAQREKIAHAAHYDPLTDLPNRTLLMDRMQHAIVQCDRRQQSLAIVYLDLDGFKEINDTYGHAIGDQLLCVLARRMKEILRDGDTLARIGGDEFVLILGAMEKEYSFIPLLERLRDVTAAPHAVGSLSLRISASMGVTVYPNDDCIPEQLIRHADQAMYEAKNSGKNRFHVFDVRMATMSKILSDRISDIKNAIENDEFELHYQPKINLRTGKVVGAEALLRWRKSHDRLLFPEEFLDIIENHSVAADIDFWVINSVLKQMSEWQNFGIDIAVSLNIFPRELQDGRFACRLESLLKQYPSISPGEIQLEVIESKDIRNTECAAKIMKECCALGVSFALDDFGTGYSSLTYLQKLPAKVIKIDKSFISDMLVNTNDLTIVKGVIGLARAFDRQVVAEGVTCAELAGRLSALGCDIVQGFGLASPMPALELGGWLSSWSGKRIGRISWH